MTRVRPSSSRRTQSRRNARNWRAPRSTKPMPDNEVAYHKALETDLIPNANNQELKDLLSTGLKIFQGHEQHAEEVARSLK